MKIWFYSSKHDYVYIKTTRNSQGQAYYHLVESYREGKKVKQRTLLSLGKSENNKINDLTTALQRHGVAIEALEKKVFQAEFSAKNSGSGSQKSTQSADSGTFTNQEFAVYISYKQKQVFS